MAINCNFQNTFCFRWVPFWESIGPIGLAVALLSAGLWRPPSGLPPNAAQVFASPSAFEEVKDNRAKINGHDLIGESVNELDAVTFNYYLMMNGSLPANSNAHQLFILRLRPCRRPLYLEAPNKCDPTPWGAANRLFFWHPLVKPLYGTWRPSIGQNRLSDFVNVPALVIVFLWFLLFINGLEWLIKACGWTLIFVCHFWNFQHVHQNWTFGPLIYCRNTLKNTIKCPNQFKTILCLHLSIFGKSIFLKILESLGENTN